MRGISLIVVCLLSVALPAAGTTAAESESKTLSPYFMVEGGDEGRECFPLKATTVSATINGVIADVKVTQEYSNTGTQPINARYIFPAGTRAAVHGMRMTVGEKVVEARIQERSKAKSVFKKAQAAGKSASLLEQQRPNVFSMNVANIMPGDTVAIELKYSELLIPEIGLYSFVYPTVAGPRYSTIPEGNADDHHQWVRSPYLPSDQKPTSRFTIKVTLAAGLPFQQIACESHATEVVWDSAAQARVMLAADETKGGNRDFILDYRLTGDQIHSGLMLYQGASENFFMLMMQPPERVAPESMPPREYIFVVDVSGSMHGFPLDTAKVLLRRLLSSLRPMDSFNVILFAGAARVLAPQSLPADAVHVKAALQLIDKQQGGGGTELYRALSKGLALPRDEDCARTMVVITDGYIAAEKEVFGLIDENLDHCNVFTFGIGSSVNRYLIEGMARAGLGEPFVVTEPQAAISAAMRFKTYIQAPVLTGIEIDFDAFEAYEYEPGGAADLFAQRPLVICGKWRGEARGTIRLSGITGNGPYSQSFDVARNLPSETNSALPYLWARKRLARLSDFNSDPEDETTRQEVIQLGLNYHLLTAHTSFVAVHETVRNLDGPAQDVDQPLPMPLHVSDLAVGAARNVPEPEINMMLVLMGVVGLVLVWRKRQCSIES